MPTFYQKYTQNYVEVIANAMLSAFQNTAWQILFVDETDHQQVYQQEMPY